MSVRSCSSGEANAE